MCLMRARPLGYLQMRDATRASTTRSSPFTSTIRLYEAYHHLEELPKHVLRELRRFFEDYKQLENKLVVVDEMRGPEAARKVIEDAKRSYAELRAKEG